MANNPIRVLVAKPGLDGHDRGAKVIAQALRNAGMEVIYTGLRQSPEQIVETAIQEDVKVIGLSSLSGAHMQLFPAVARLLQAQGAGDILLIGGGVIPADDIPKLKSSGLAELFTPGTPTRKIVNFIQDYFQTDACFANKLDHIGIAVNNIEDNLQFYSLLGLKCTGIEEIADQQVRVACLPVGNSELELLEPTTPQSSVAKFLAARGEGIHHIAYRVPNIAAALARLRTQGIRLLDEQPRPGAGGASIAFIHPKAAGGVLTEICQRNL